MTKTLTTLAAVAALSQPVWLGALPPRDHWRGHPLVWLLRWRVRVRRIWWRPVQCGRRRLPLALWTLSGTAMAGASAACRSAIDLRILNCRSDNLSSDRRLALQDDGRLAFGLIHQISDKLAERY